MAITDVAASRADVRRHGADAPRRSPGCVRRRASRPRSTGAIRRCSRRCSRRYGEVEVAEHQLTHQQASPEEFWDRWERLHPMWIAARRSSSRRARWEPMREEAIAALRADGIGDGATSPYLLAVLTRG